MLTQWPFFLNYIYKTFDQFNQQILSRFKLLPPSDQQYLLTKNDQFRNYLSSLQKIYLVYKRIKNSYSFFTTTTNSIKSSSNQFSTSLLRSLSFIQIDQLLMDMMDDLIQYDLYLICETDPFLIEPSSSSSSSTGDSGMERIVDPNGGGCPVCLFPIGNQLLDDTAWKFHSVCFNFYNHLEKIA